MHIDLTTLRLFLTVYDAQSISSAAAIEHIAISAVSKRINDLEHHVGAKLFYRRPRGVAPTAAADALAVHARSIFGIMDRMRSELSEHAQGVRGHVRVFANTSGIVGGLADDLGKFRDRYPNIRTDVHEDLSSSVVQAVRDGVADLGVFASGASIPPELDRYKYRASRLCVAINTSHPLAQRQSVSFDEIVDLDHVGGYYGSSIMNLVTEAARARGRRMQIQNRVSSCDAVRQMVHANLGVAILPPEVVRPYETLLNIKAVALDDSWARRELCICARRVPLQTVPARLLLDTLVGAQPAVPHGKGAPRLRAVGDPHSHA